MRKLLLVLIPFGAQAQDLAPRESDVLLDQTEMIEDVVGQTHEFFDGGQSFFSISGSYSYTYPDGGIAYGRWDIPNDVAPGVICTYFRHGFSRCDRYVRSNGRLLLITDSGDRFPIRESR